MKTDKIIILFLILSILYLLAQRYKEEQRSPLDKAKELIQNILDDIPKKMQKVIVKSKDSFPDGLIKLASTVADSNPTSGKNRVGLLGLVLIISCAHCRFERTFL